MRKLQELFLKFLRGAKKPMPWQHGPKFQKEQKQKSQATDLPRDKYGRWIIGGGEPNDWNYGKLNLHEDDD